MSENKPTPWQRACRFNLTHSRLTRRRLNAFAAPLATRQRVLLVHCGDLDHPRLFPNALRLPGKTFDAVRAELDGLGDEVFPIVACTGLLEHVPDPAQLIDHLHRRLRPGGRLLLSASAVFPFHGGHQNYFHFTPGGLRELLSPPAWRIEQLEGSTQPFETLGVLLQRINLQCDVFPPVRLLIEGMMRLAPLLDRGVFRQYVKNARRDGTTRVDTIMPATLHVVARKAHAAADAAPSS